MTEKPAAPVIDVQDLHVEFTQEGRIVYAVNGVSFALAPGETLGIVGESGSGKSAVLRSLIGLHPHGSARLTGSVIYQGRDLLGMRERDLRSIRGAEISMIFQDPMSYLNPVMTVGAQIDETLRRHTGLDRKARRVRVIELLELVGINAPEQRVRQYPHQLSGGMRQRVMIAMAFACEPKVLLADEPTTALDVSVQAQVLRLIANLCQQMGMSAVIVSHDLGVIAQSCDRVVVMYAGQLVEVGQVREVIVDPTHPYTMGLLRSLPGEKQVLDAEKSRYLEAIPGTPPRLTETPVRCSFMPRCSSATDACSTWSTELLDIGQGRLCRCINQSKVDTSG